MFLLEDSNSNTLSPVRALIFLSWLIERVTRILQEPYTLKAHLVAGLLFKWSFSYNQGFVGSARIDPALCVHNFNRWKAEKWLKANEKFSPKRVERYRRLKSWAFVTTTFREHGGRRLEQKAFFSRNCRRLNSSCSSLCLLAREPFLRSLPHWQFFLASVGSHEMENSVFFKRKILRSFLSAVLSSRSVAQDLNCCCDCGCLN